MTKAEKVFMKSLIYIKNHNSEDDNTDSLDFDSMYLDLPSDTDVDELICEGQLDSLLDRANLTWHNDDNGALYILPKGSADPQDALSVNELLNTLNPIATKTGISKKSFDDIKLIQKIMHKQVEDNEGSADCDLANLSPNAKKLMPKKFNNDNDGLAEMIQDNDDLMNAGNFNIHFDEDEDTAYSREQDIANPDEDPLTYEQVDYRIDKVVALGRNGIYRVCLRNKKLNHKIMDIQDTMNDIAID